MLILAVMLFGVAVITNLVAVFGVKDKGSANKLLAASGILKTVVILLLLGMIK